MSFTFAGPPRLNDGRAYELARLQCTAFFYFLTRDGDTGQGGWWPGGFYPIHLAPLTDWGNPVHRAFTNGIAAWDYRLIVTTAGGYFRTVLRRHPTSEVWAWAVEWNAAYRLIGLLGNEQDCREVASNLPTLEASTVLKTATGYLAYRTEDELPDDHDTLFTMPTEA